MNGYLGAVRGELAAEEPVRDEDLGDHVDEVEALAGEELDGPHLVLGAVPDAFPHVVGQRAHLVVAGRRVADVDVQTRHDVLMKKLRQTGKLRLGIFF